MLQYIKIGNIELGVDGVDTYYEVSSNEDAVDYDSVFNDAMKNSTILVMVQDRIIVTIAGFCLTHCTIIGQLS